MTDAKSIPTSKPDAAVLTGALTLARSIAPTDQHRRQRIEAGGNADSALAQLRAALLDAVALAQHILKNLPEGDANLVPLNAILKQLT